jgi:aldehyde:ferredoxin oxidoreductase
MPYGYTGNILRVDLTTKKHWTEHPPETFYRTYWGGRALSLYYMLKEMKAKTNPFSPRRIRSRRLVGSRTKESWF